MQKTKIKILFLCTGNSCRSQMAEGWAKYLKSNSIEAYSAGTKPKGLDPLAIEAMKEVGIDVSNYTSKSLEDLKDVNFDFIVTVCGDANESCPIFPGKTIVIHQGFEDPPKLARDAKSKEEALVHYRRVRGQIKKFIETIPESLLKIS